MHPVHENGQRLLFALLLSPVLFADHAMPIDLSDVAAGQGGFVFQTNQNADASSVVSGAGDVNGDGFDDVIVGAPTGRPRFSSDACGLAYVILGKAETGAVSGLDIFDGDGGFVINGISHPSTTELTGRSVSGAGDVNGDGLDDVFVGAPTSHELPGNGYVVFGKLDSVPVNWSDVENGEGGFALYGVPGTDVTATGWSVSGAGDVNGDGLDDLLIGTTYTSTSTLQNIYYHIVFGKAETTAVELSHVESGVGGIAIRVPRWGLPSVSGAGDVNNDDLADVVVSAENSDGAYVIFGKTTTDIVDITDIEQGVGGFVVRPLSETEFGGYGASRAGDVNGDGFADLVLTDHRFNEQTSSYAREGFVVFGRATTAPVYVSDVAAGIGGFRIHATGVVDRFPAAAGDVNDDGLADVLVGFSTAPDGPSTERAAVVYGKTDTDPVWLPEVAANWGGFVIEPGIGFIRFSDANDVNGDGIADIIISSSFTPGRPQNFVVFGFIPPPLDTDSDLLPDEVETLTGVFVDATDTGSDPEDWDTDDDGFPDGMEVGLGTDPNDPLDFPTGLALGVPALLALFLGAAALHSVNRCYRS